MVVKGLKAINFITAKSSKLKYQNFVYWSTTIMYVYNLLVGIVWGQKKLCRDGDEMGTRPAGTGGTRSGGRGWGWGQSCKHGVEMWMNNCPHSALYSTIVGSGGWHGLTPTSS